MKVPYSWLKDYVEINMDPKKLAHFLTMAGLTVTACESINGDYIFEFEITSNRSDCLSIFGIARETAAILGKKLKTPGRNEKKIISKIKEKAPIKISINARKLCPHYTARIIRDVEVGESPAWLKKKIISVGLRPVNNVVDITNFVLFETGQPLHAFDMGKIRGEIRIREAKSGEKIITVDKVARVCKAGTLLISDDKQPIAIAGIMGGLATEVNRMTKNVLLESAFFDPISIRKTVRSLGVSSESSYRFERKIDNKAVRDASNRASFLIEKIANGKVCQLIERGRKKGHSKTITIDFDRINTLLGISMKKKEALKILKALSFNVKLGKKFAKITIPSFRGDIKCEVDIVEEIARMYGYDKIPATIPKIIGNTKIKDPISTFQDELCSMLTSLGLNEIITHSLIKRGDSENLGVSGGEIIIIKNPLSIDQEVMRPTLIPGMLSVVSRNLNRKVGRIALFEIGKAYKKKAKLYAEDPILAIALSGNKAENWKIKKEEFNFFDTKGVVEKVLADIKLEKVSFKRAPLEGFREGTSAVIECDGHPIGKIGEINKKIQKKFNIKKSVMYSEFCIKSLFQNANTIKRYTPLGRYPSVVRDISILAEVSVASAEIMDVINETGKSLVKKVTFISRYKGSEIDVSKQALLYRIEYRSDERTLEDTEVDKLNVKIRQNLSEKLYISFR